MPKRGNTCLCTFVVAVLVCTGRIGLSQGQDGLRHDLAKKFGFTWEAVELSARLKNTAGSDTVDPNALSRDLTISVHLDIRDRTGLVGMAVDNARILEVLDGQGKVVQRIPDASERMRQHMKVGYVSVSENWRRVQKLKPSEVPIRLHLAPDNGVPSVLSRIHGYVYALYADDIIEVDVPFEPVGQWVKVAPNLEIQVDPDTLPPPGPVEYEPRPDRIASPHRLKTPRVIHGYATCVRSKTGKSVRGLSDELKDGEAFGPYLVIETKLYDSARKITYSVGKQSVRGECRGGTRAHSVYCGGSTIQGHDTYDMIRHVIAVNPREVKIPFTLTNVPVPSLAAARSGGE